MVTRPQPQCDEWVEHLRQSGWDALPFPLLTLGASPEPEKVRQTFEALLKQPSSTNDAAWQAVMVVSGAAYTGMVQALGQNLHARLLAQCKNGLRFWVTGPGSAKVLRAAGVPPEAIDCPLATDGTLLDSEALWDLVRPQLQACPTPPHVVLVRGADEEGHYAGNPWLAEQVREAGGQVQSVLAYQRLAPRWNAHRQAIWESALEEQHPCIWLFSSSQGLQNLPHHDWTGAKAVATHPRIAAKVRDLGFSQVRLATPTLDAVLASLKSFDD